MADGTNTLDGSYRQALLNPGVAKAIAVAYFGKKGTTALRRPRHINQPVAHSSARAMLIMTPPPKFRSVQQMNVKLVLKKC